MLPSKFELELFPSIEIPDEYEKLELVDQKGSAFSVILDRKRDLFEQWLFQERPATIIVRVIQLMLEGCGSLIDVGSHVGTIAIPVAKDGSQVFAFEMNPESCIKLSIGRYVNCLSNMYITQAALTDREKILYFVGSGPWASISRNPSTATVAGYRLDFLLGMLTSTMKSHLCGDVVLKIDAEGHDYQVLCGASLTIERYNPIIIYESMMGGAKQGSLAAAEFLKERKYILFAIHDKVVAPIDSLGKQEAFLVDYLALPHSKAKRILSQIQKEVEVRPQSCYERLECVRVAADSNDTLEHPLHAIDVIAGWQFSDQSMAEAAFRIASSLKNHHEKVVRDTASEKLR